MSLRQERPEVKSHRSSKGAKTKNTSKKDVQDLIEKEKDEMLSLAKHTKALNEQTLHELDFQKNELKSTKENYLEPMKTYNALGNRLLNGMAWGGFFKNLWSYSKWRKMEKESGIITDPIMEKKRNLNFHDNSFDILCKSSDGRHCKFFEYCSIYTTSKVIHLQLL